MTPQLEKIVWNGARTTGNPVYPQGGSSFKRIRKTEVNTKNFANDSFKQLWF